MKHNMFKPFRSLMLTAAVTIALSAGNSAQATSIPTLAFTCTKPLTSAFSCVTGYFAMGWLSGGYWEYTVNTVPYSNITMTFSTRKSSAVGPTAGSVYYNIGFGDTYLTSFTLTTTCTPHTISFPAVCSNQPNMRVKVVMTGATSNTAAVYIPSDGGFDGI